MRVNDAYYLTNCYVNCLERLTPEALNFLDKEQRFIRSHVSEGDSILEVGCGTGRILSMLAPHVAHLTGIDFSPVLLEESSKVACAYGNKIDLVLGDAARLPLRSGSYTLAIMDFNTLNSLNDSSEGSQLKVLREANRVLSKNGRIMLTVWAENAVDAQLELYRAFGFSDVVEINGNYVHVRSSEGIDLRSGRSSQAKLEDLLQRTGFKGKIESLTDFSYACIADKV